MFRIMDYIENTVPNKFQIRFFFFFYIRILLQQGEVPFLCICVVQILVPVCETRTLRLARTQSRNAKTLYLFSKSCSFHDLEDLDVEGFLNNIYQF